MTPDFGKALQRIIATGNSAIKVTSADPGNDPFQNTEASYSALNVQPFTTEDSRLYCEIRLSEQSSADYGNQACEQKRSKGEYAIHQIMS